MPGHDLAFPKLEPTRNGNILIIETQPYEKLASKHHASYMEGKTETNKNYRLDKTNPKKA
jgi:hypothetical protein